ATTPAIASTLPPPTAAAVVSTVQPPPQPVAPAAQVPMAEAATIATPVVPAGSTSEQPASSADIENDDEFDPADEFPEHPPTVGGGRRWFIALLLLLAVGGGVLAWYNTRPESSTVPELAGMRQGAALNQIGPFKATITEEASETVEAGVVIRTEPSAGTELENGTTITLVVSTGPAPRALPELAGVTVADATATLTELGLVLIEADPVYDEVVAPGLIVSWTVPAAPTLAAGATVTKGTTVQVVASAGPAPRTVPDLANLPFADATAAVQALGLVIAQVPDEFSSTVAVGAVIRQDVPPGSTIARGATVTVALSKGPDLVAMPSLAGLDYNGIVAALQAAGLATGTITGDTTQPFLSATANGSTIVDGQQFLRGTAIDLTFAPTPVVASTTVPGG
ncbi:MAG: PASTA domain-containing protein, partial [Ilumatobacteraceae bacterium]